MIATYLSRAPNVEAGEKVLECSFRSLEFVNAMYVGEGSKIPVPKLSKTTYTTLKQVLGKRVRADKGLGKRLQGMFSPITVIQKKDRFGVGYKPDLQGRRKLIKEKKKERESPVSSVRQWKILRWKSPH